MHSESWSNKERDLKCSHNANFSLLKGISKPVYEQNVLLYIHGSCGSNLRTDIRYIHIGKAILLYLTMKLGFTIGKREEI